MKSFIFYTSEGYTYDSEHKEASNMQILGHGEGEDIDEAFINFKKNQSYLSTQAYRNVMALQTIGNTIYNLEV